MSDDEDLVIAEARIAWDTGDPKRAARILEDYLACHPERRVEFLAKARAPPVESDQTSDDAALPSAALDCLRCGAHVPLTKRTRLHEGGYLADWFFDADLFVGRLEADVYACQSCGHIELVTPDAHLTMPVFGQPRARPATTL